MPFNTTRKTFAGFLTPAYGRSSLGTAGLFVSYVLINSSYQTAYELTRRAVVHVYCF